MIYTYRSNADETKKSTVFYGRRNAGLGGENGVAFGKAKTEAMFLSKMRKNPTETVRVGGYATRWFGVWIDSQMTLKEHLAVRVKKTRSTAPSSGGATRKVPRRLQEGARGVRTYKRRRYMGQAVVG